MTKFEAALALFKVNSELFTWDAVRSQKGSYAVDIMTNEHNGGDLSLVDYIVSDLDYWGCYYGSEHKKVYDNSARQACFVRFVLRVIADAEAVVAPAFKETVNDFEVTGRIVDGTPSFVISYKGGDDDAYHSELPGKSSMDFNNIECSIANTGEISVVALVDSTPSAVVYGGDNCTNVIKAYDTVCKMMGVETLIVVGA